MKLTLPKKDPDQIYNIRVKQLFSLSNIEPYKALNYITDSNQIGKYKGKLLSDCTYEQVMEIRSCQKMTIDKISNFFKWVYGIPKKQFLKLRVLDFYKGLNYITKQSELLLQAFERTTENKINNAIWKKAGGDKFIKYGDYNPVLSLAFALNKSITEIHKLSYGEVITMQQYKNDYDHVIPKYHLLSTPKN